MLKIDNFKGLALNQAMQGGILVIDQESKTLSDQKVELQSINSEEIRLNLMALIENSRRTN